MAAVEFDQEPCLKQAKSANIRADRNLSAKMGLETGTFLSARQSRCSGSVVLERAALRGCVESGLMSPISGFPLRFSPHPGALSADPSPQGEGKAAQP